MFKLNDIVQAVPESNGKSYAVPARVCYIHPLGRFYELEFHFTNMNGGVYRESRFFTPSEYEEGLAMGLFRSRLSARQNNPCPMGYTKGYPYDDYYEPREQNKPKEFDPAMI